jgi:hypothetical protein
MYNKQLLLKSRFSSIFQVKTIMPYMAAVVFSFLYYGIDITSWRIYCIEYLEMLENYDYYITDTYIPIVIKNMGLILKYFTVFSSYIFKIPMLFIIISIIIKIIIIWIIKEILLNFGFEKSKALLLASFLIISIGYWNGAVHLGIWGSPVYYRGSIVAILFLLGFLSFIRYNFLVGAIFVGISFHFHLFNAIAAFIFLYPGLVYFLQKNNNFKAILVTTIIPIVFLIPFYLKSQSLSLSNNLMPLEDWFGVIYSRDADDVSIREWIGARFMFFVLLPFYFKNDNKQKHQILLDAIIKGGLLVLSICIVMELFHFNNIFFGRLSEIFITIQMHRGLWILGLLSVVSIFYLLSYYEKEWQNKWLYLIPLSTVLLIFNWNNILALSLITFLFIWNYKNENGVRNYFLTFILLLLIITQPIFLNPFNIKGDILIITTFCIFALFMYYTKYLNHFNIWTKSKILISIVIILTLGMSSKEQRLFNDLYAIKKHGYFKKLSYKSIVLLQFNKVNKWSYPTVQKETEDYFTLLHHVEIINKNHDRVLLHPPRHLGLHYVSYKLIAKSPVIFCENEDRGVSLYSREYTSYYQDRIETIFDLKLSEIYNSSYYNTKFDDLFNNITSEKINYLFNNNIIKYFISHKNYENLKTILTVGDFKLYSL